MAQRISSDILRFHVLANSNTKKDQELKLMVKTYLLDELSKTDMDSKEGFSRYVSEHKHELESSAESYMESLGYSYQADIALPKVILPRPMATSSCRPGHMMLWKYGWEMAEGATGGVSYTHAFAS